MLGKRLFHDRSQFDHYLLNQVLYPIEIEHKHNAHNDVSHAAQQLAEAKAKFAEKRKAELAAKKAQQKRPARKPNLNQAPRKPKANNFDIDVYIYPAYQDLLTDKSVFWVESAAQIDITPKGISIQASPVARSLKGAISFDNTGSGKNKTLYPSELRAKSAETGRVTSTSIPRLAACKLE